MDLLDWISVFSLACALIIGYMILSSRRPKLSSDSTQSSGHSGFLPPARKVNDCLHELYKPSESPNMQIIFFHGLHSEDEVETYLSTWKSGDGSCIWPQTWLVKEFPCAQVFCVSYTASVKKRLKKNSQGCFDMYNIGENLVSDILGEDVGQAPYCPVVLVGHCFGGLVIKQLCLDSHKVLNLSKSGERHRLRLEKFLKSIRGVFFYGTPHHGSPLMDKAVDELESPLLMYFKMLSLVGERLNFDFDKFRTNLYPTWRIHGLGESQSAKSGVFRGLVGAPEATSRAGDVFNVLEADHVNICRPMTKTDRRFYGLTELLHTIATDLEEEQEEARVREEARKQNAARLSQNFPRLPKQITGIDGPIREVEDKLVNARTLRLVGMGGRGKTTLAKAIFNKLATGFEYSSFLLEVKLVSGGVEDVKKVVWSQMHHGGQQIQTEPNWAVLRNRKLLLILDDVSDRDLDVLFDIAEDSAPNSRFIVTSRDWELVKALDDVYDVPLLNDDFAKQLFSKHAFPGHTPPSELEHLVSAIVRKCDGLPLTLEVLGKYLHTKQEREDWEQTLDALDRAEAVTGLNERLWSKLKLSFDGLQAKEQELFLDAASFFCVEFTLREARIAWKAAYAPVNERLLWRTLVDRSLVYDVKDDDCIQMHEQLLSLGKRIGGEDCKKRRVWNPTQAMELLQATSDQNIKEMFALRLNLIDKELTVARSVLLGLREVRYLHLRGLVNIDELVPLLTNLVFFKCNCAKLRSEADSFNFASPSRLVFLDLSFFFYKHLPDSITKLSDLKIFKLSCNFRLKSLPKEIGHLRRLQILDIFSCIMLKELPDSFGGLSALNSLRFADCGSLQYLPESFGHLVALSKLQFESCHSLQLLPESFGQLSGLQHLKFVSCGALRGLPNSFGKLKKLEDLKMSNCLRLDMLPKSFGDLIALRDFGIENLGLTAVPDSIRSLRSLQVLELGFLPFVKELPSWLGGVEADLGRTSIKAFHFQDEEFTLDAVRHLGYMEHMALIEALHKIVMEKVRTSNLVTRCDECGMYPLGWPRYESHTRSSFVLCHYCFHESGSNASEYCCTDRPVCHPLVGCDDCQMSPLEGPRYKSSTRSDFDLCQGCLQKRGSNASEYICIDPPVLSANDGTVAILDTTLSLYDIGLARGLEAQHPFLGHDKLHSLNLSGPKVFILQERGILKRLAGDLPGALEDLNQAVQIIGLTRSFVGFDDLEGHYKCCKHRSYVKFLLGDLNGARKDAEEAMSVRNEMCDGSELPPGSNEALGGDPVKFLEFEFD